MSKSLFHATQDDNGNISIHFSRELLAGCEGTFISHTLDEVMNDNVRNWKEQLGLTDKNYKKKIQSLLK